MQSTYYIPAKIDAKLQASANRLGISKSALLRELIEQEETQMLTKVEKANSIDYEEIVKLIELPLEQHAQVSAKAEKLFKSYCVAVHDHSGDNDQQAIASVTKAGSPGSEVAAKLYALTRITDMKSFADFKSQMREHAAVEIARKSLEA